MYIYICIYIYLVNISLFTGFFDIPGGCLGFLNHQQGMRSAMIGLPRNHRCQLQRSLGIFGAKDSIISIPDVNLMQTYANSWYKPSAKLWSYKSSICIHLLSLHFCDFFWRYFVPNTPERNTDGSGTNIRWLFLLIDGCFRGALNLLVASVLHRCHPPWGES